MTFEERILEPFEVLGLKRSGTWGVSDRQIREWLSGNVKPTQRSLEKFVLAVNAEAERLNVDYRIKLLDLLAALAKKKSTSRRRSLQDAFSRQIERLSRMALAEATRISAPEDALNVSLANVYVPRRDVEKKLGEQFAKQVQSGVNVPRVIVGDPGTGKTSLLWRLVSNRGEEIFESAFFIKATWLIDGTVDHQKLIDLVQEQGVEGDEILVGIDTIDLLVHDDSRKGTLIGCIEELVGAGAHILATCRPREARLLDSLEFRSLTIANYSEEELPEAVAMYMGSLFQDSDGVEERRQTTRITESVSKGRPVAEVCRNPLTLRILFMLYVPKEVPEEINVFQLYCEYWNRRVVADLRAEGSSSHDKLDLSETAETVAIEMLRSGSLEIDPSRLDSPEVRSEDIDRLMSRGVLVRSDQGMISFFHQTFFEHAAARRVTRRCSYSVMEEFIFAHPSDTFVIPVFEKAMLLCRDRVEVDRLLCRCVRSGKVSVEMAGVFVYAHKIDHMPQATEVLREILGDGRHIQLAKEFVRLAVNAPIRRADEVFHVLDATWRKQTPPWNFIVTVLEFLSTSSPAWTQHAQAFLSKSDRFQACMEVKGEGRKELWHLAKVVECLANSDPAWAWERIQELHTAIVKSSGSQEQHGRISSAIASNVEFLDLKGVRGFMSSWIVRMSDISSADFVSAMCLIYGRVFAATWAHECTAIETIAEDIRGEKDDRSRRQLLIAGLSHYVRKREIKVSEFSIHGRLSQAFDSVPARHWVWMHFFWKPLLSMKRTPAWALEAISKRIREEIVSGEINRGETCGEALCVTIARARPSRETIRELFTHADFGPEHVWLENDPMVNLTVVGYLAGLSGPKSLFEHVKSGGARGCEIARKLVGTVREIAKKSSAEVYSGKEVTRMMLIVGIKSGVLSVVRAALERSNEGEVEELVGEDQRRELLKLVHSHRSDIVDERRAAVWIEASSIAWGWISSSFRWEDVESRILRVRDEMVRRELVKLIVISVRVGLSKADEARKVFLRMCEAPISEGLQRDVIRGRIEIATMDDSEILAREAVELAVAPPASTERLLPVGRILARWVVRDANVAVGHYLEIVKGVAMKGLGRSALTKMSFAFHEATTNVLREAGIEGRKVILGSLLEIPFEISATIVKEVCLRYYGECEETLRGLIDDGAMDPRLVLIVQREKWRRGPETGSQLDYQELVWRIEEGG